MKKIFIIAAILVSTACSAQQFISSGMIEFEVRTNNHKSFGDGIWAEMFKDKMPQFSTSWYQYTFNDNKAVYKYNRKDEKNKLPWSRGEEEDNLWYSDYTAGTFAQSKFVFDNTYLLSDSLMKIDWKISPNETREIAGFNCRKATGIIFDSVYVFAFYTDEITVSGGPMGIHGLPGMILGITIPRMYTSWIATKLQVTGVNTNIIAAPQKGKKKVAKELQESLIKVTSDWGSYGQQAIWNIFL
ncbi:MAG: GLPGLI family protein [Chitinophagaceae bacterium]|jgi:GLPGLI family protein|nr:GLPGLI family protein [Chitinophagaceae bacterium]